MTERVCAVCKRGLLFFMGTALVACGGNGGSGPPQPTPTPRPTPAPAAAVELAGGVAPSTIAAIAAVLGQNATSTVGGMSADAAQLRRVVIRTALLADTPAAPNDADIRPAVVTGCARGGTINGSCTSGGGSTTVTATLSNCGLAEPGTTNTLTASGGLTVTLEAPGLCGASTLPPGVAFSSRFSSFSGTVTNSVGAVIERFLANLSETVRPSGQGCAGMNATGSVDGMLSDEIDASGINVSLVARNITFSRSSSGTPCVQEATVSGGLDVDDHFEPRSFSETFTGLRVTLAVADNHVTQATLDGSVNSDCLGDVQFHTLMPLQFPLASECPSAGLLAVTRLDGTNGQIQFTPANGIEFDFNADGTPDKVVSSCGDAAQCSR